MLPLSMNPRARRLAGLPPLGGGGFGGAGASFDMGADPGVAELGQTPTIEMAAAPSYTNADLPTRTVTPARPAMPALPSSTFAEADPTIAPEPMFQADSPADSPESGIEDQGAWTLPEDFRLPRPEIGAGFKDIMSRVSAVPPAPAGPITDEVVGPPPSTVTGLFPAPMFAAAPLLGARPSLSLIADQGEKIAAAGDSAGAEVPYSGAWSLLPREIAAAFHGLAGAARGALVRGPGARFEPAAAPPVPTPSAAPIAQAARPRPTPPKPSATAPASTPGKVETTSTGAPKAAPGSIDAAARASAEAKSRETKGVPLYTNADLERVHQADWMPAKPGSGFAMANVPAVMPDSVIEEAVKRKAMAELTAPAGSLTGKQQGELAFQKAKQAQDVGAIQEGMDKIDRETEDAIRVLRALPGFAKLPPDERTRREQSKYRIGEDRKRTLQQIYGLIGAKAAPSSLYKDEESYP